MMVKMAKLVDRSVFVCVMYVLLAMATYIHADEASRCFVGAGENGLPITSLTVAPGSPDLIIVGITDGTRGELRVFDAADISAQIAGASAFGAGADGLAIDGNGNLLASGMDIEGKARVQQHAIPNVESSPNGYPYPSIPLGANGSALVAAADGTNFFAVAKDVGVGYYRTYDWGRPIAQPYDYVDWGGPVNAVASTSQGYAVFGTASGFALGNRVWIRGIAEGSGLWYAPAGYEDTTGEFGSAVTSLAVTSDDNILIGLANGHVSLRPAASLTTTLNSIDFGTAHPISAVAITADGNYALIATDDGGYVHVRPLNDLAAIATSAVQFGGTVTGLASIGQEVIVGTSTGGLFVRNQSDLSVGQSAVIKGQAYWNTVPAVSVTADSELGVDRGAINTINGSGMTADGLLHVSGIPQYKMWVSGDTPASHPYVDAGTHWIKYSFDQPYSISEMWIWNGNESPNYDLGWVGPDGGMKQVRILASMTDDEAGWTAANSIPVFEGIIPIATGTDSNPVNLVVDFAGLQAQHILIVSDAGNDHNWSNGLYPGDYLSEVRFYVPQPQGDITGDCCVNTDDLTVLSGQWAQCTMPGNPECSQTPDSIPSYYIAEAPAGGITVDGNLNEWPADSEWIWLDENYFGYAYPDVTEARFALRWSETTDTIYLAVVVDDPEHSFSDIPTGQADIIEIYSQGDASGGTGWGASGTGYFDVAQQYFVGPDSAGTSYWTSWADLTATNSDAEFEAAVSVDGDIITYEVGIKQFDDYGGISGGNTVVTQLSSGMLVAFDVIVDTVFYNTERFSMLSENLLTGKFDNAGQFQLYELTDSLPTQNCGMWGYLSPDINHDCMVDLLDFAELAASWSLCGN